MMMEDNTKIESSYRETSDEHRNKKAESFRRFEFNHPLNPFRLTSDKTRMRMSHLNAKDVNEGVIAYFEKKLNEIQKLILSQNKDVSMISTLTNDLYHEVSTSSTIPCTANIDAAIFEHLNYILQLLYDWQDYATILKEIEKDSVLYIEKVTQKFELSPQEVEMKINHFNSKFIDLTKVILSEILLIKKAIRK